MKIKNIFKNLGLLENTGKTFFLFYKISKDLDTLKEGYFKLREPENLDIDIIFSSIIKSLSKSITEAEISQPPEQTSIEQNPPEQTKKTLKDISENLFALSKIFPLANNFIITISDNTHKLNEKTNIKGEVGFWIKSRENPQTNEIETNISIIQNGLKDNSNMNFSSDINNINNSLNNSLKEIGDYVNKLINT